MTYTAVTLMLLGELKNPSQVGSWTRWLYVKNVLNKLDTHKVPPSARRDLGKGSTGMTPWAGPWELPSWSEDALTRSMWNLARLASRQQPSGSADTDTERRDAVLLLEKILNQVKIQIGDVEFESDNRTYRSFKEAMDKAHEAKRTFEPERRAQGP